MVGPAREIVEPLAAVAGADRALSRAEVLARPLQVVERATGTMLGIQAVARPPPPEVVQAPAPREQAPSRTRPATRRPPPSPTSEHPPPLRTAPAPGVDLMALIDEELVDEPKARPVPTRVEVSVSLVSEHNFYVGPDPAHRLGRRLHRHRPAAAGGHPAADPPRAWPTGARLDLEGEVAFVREKSATTGRQPSGCGVKLHGLPGWASDAIDRFVMARQPIVFMPR